ncbi:RDD family protein [Microbacterium sp. zg.Y625]|uniref:RDD family protein n=1 Tax=Microbacterium jiangjiandongii TaxID=3049071 RepID=UPI00214B54BB|nr:MULTISPECIES: RDD family protein [unclassified Microbacterium]MCR2794339.1 RDD family protein [Microbacterium sp. zg.Y625]MCR2816347.1 RDD family protein [Microbacterium sp. zg.Y843]WIM25614.1 RDD family protein [Microbacterium sp. zg-Y625]
MSLLSHFAGAPASVGARLGAFSIDAALVAGVTATGMLLGSPVLGLALGAEALLGLWILEARTGATPGVAMLRLRVAREDAPFSPGAGRTFVRGLLLLLSSLVLLAGAWVVVASAAWDRTGRRRSWHDKASETVVVALPDRRAPGPAATLDAPTVLGRSAGAAARPVAPAAGAEVPAAGMWGEFLPPAAPAAPSAAAAPALALPADVAPRRPLRNAQVLLVFDTGQRAQFALPAAVNLGRAPAPTDPGDAVLAVEDPDRMVSKMHLRLEHDGETAWVTDAGSTNGSELVDEEGAGRPLAPGVRTPLDEGTRVRVGERIFTVSRLIGTSA